MYLNKLLFPAPQSSYDLKTVENLLLYFPRQKSRKAFKINRKRESKSEERKKSSTTNSKNLKLKDFQLNEHDTVKIPRENRSGSHDPTPERKNKLSYIDEDIPNERSHEEKTTNDISDKFMYILDLDKVDTGHIKKQESHENYDEELKINFEKQKSKEDKSKTKKKKNNCFGFLVKVHKDKKVDLEMFNGSQPHNGFKFDNHAGLNQLSPEMIKEIISKKDEIHKDSSSESEDDVQDHIPGPSTKKLIYIPCLFLQADINTPRTLIYFHGNGEDIYQSYELIQNLQKNLMINVIAMEYPGYGIYKGSSSERKILFDAETVYKYLTSYLKINEKDIYLFGRSIGSGPACWLASIKNPGLLILMSAFTSIRGVVKHIGGSVAQFFVKERFKNIKHITNVTCPVLIVHGKKDTLIPEKHAKKLYDAIPGKKKLHLSEEMTHVDYDYFGDIGVPLTLFLKELNFINFKSTGEQMPLNVEPFRKPNPELIRKIEPHQSHPTDIIRGRSSLSNNAD